jgi:1-deoxy-D-xylulose-5-phosphate reductoisomerase
MSAINSAPSNKAVTVLGATGSIGRNALDVIARNPQDYSVVGLSAYKNVGLMQELIETYRPRQVSMHDLDACAQLQSWSHSKGIELEVLPGAEGLCALAGDNASQIVVAGIVGVAGLPPILEAARNGKRLLLANKEALVCAGALLTETVAKHGGKLLPVDSEHNGIFQCLNGDMSARVVKRLILTASGGPLLDYPVESFARVTPEQAVAHPVWSMGPKISVDSATMMNKGLEIIEAAYLFDRSVDEVEAVIHPQGIVHAMVEFSDGNVLAQLSRPDMRGALAVGLAWPERIASGVKPLDILRLGNLEFRPPDQEKFPCLELARDALRQGKDAPASLNAGNEVAVSAFLQEVISFDKIAVVVEAGLSAAQGNRIEGLHGLREVDERARERSQMAVRKISGQRAPLVAQNLA